MHAPCTVHGTDAQQLHGWMMYRAHANCAGQGTLHGIFSPCTLYIFSMLAIPHDDCVMMT